MQRQCMGSSRAFSLDIVNNFKQRVMRVDRPFQMSGQQLDVAAGLGPQSESLIIRFTVVGYCSDLVRQSHPIVGFVQRGRLRARCARQSLVLDQRAVSVRQLVCRYLHSDLHGRRQSAGQSINQSVYFLIDWRHRQGVGQGRQWIDARVVHGCRQF